MSLLSGVAQYLRRIIFFFRIQTSLSPCVHLVFQKTVWGCQSCRILSLNVLHLKLQCTQLSVFPVKFLLLPPHLLFDFDFISEVTHYCCCSCIPLCQLIYQPERERDTSFIIIWSVNQCEAYSLVCSPWCEVVYAVCFGWSSSLEHYSLPASLP